MCNMPNALISYKSNRQWRKWDGAEIMRLNCFTIKLKYTRRLREASWKAAAFVYCWQIMKREGFSGCQYINKSDKTFIALSVCACEWAIFLSSEQCNVDICGRVQNISKCTFEYFQYNSFKFTNVELNLNILMGKQIQHLMDAQKKYGMFGP